MIKMGVLGCSTFAARSILPALREMTDRYRIVGVASRSLEKAEAFTEPFGVRAFGSYDALLAKDELDAVYMPLPVGIHTEWIGRALDRGLHVLVEKSLASNAADVRLLCEKAAAKRLALVENFQFRFHPQLARIKALVEEGALGDLRCVRASFGCPPFPDEDNIRYRSDLGGGALLDLGAYTLKISQLFLGPDLDITSAVLNDDEVHGVDAWGGGFLQQQKGTCFSEVAFGFDNAYQCSLELWGSKGRLFTNRIFTAPPGYSPVIRIETPEGVREETLPPANHFICMLEHFHGLCTQPEHCAGEYRQNIRQAELVQSFREKAHG